MKWAQIAFWYLSLAFFASLPYHLRINNSIFILLVLFWFLAAYWKNLILFFRENKMSWLLIGLFAVNVLGLFNTEDMDRAWFNLDKKLQLVLFPFILGPALMQRDSNKLFLVFSGSCTLALLYCFGLSGIEYFQEGDPSVFFYHELSNHIGRSAVYLSLYLAWTIVFLLHWRKESTSLSPVLTNVWIAFLLLGIFFLSSKSLFLFVVAYTLFFIALEWKVTLKTKLLGFGLGLAGLIAALSFSPLGERVGDILDSRIELAQSDSFRYDTDFDGLSMRLTFWNIAVEILNEQDAWILGVGPGDSQPELTKKYIEKGIYTGNPNFGDKGYRDHNTHNQYVETTLKSGIVGLIALLLLMFVPSIWAIRKRQFLILAFQLLFAWLMLSEAVFERQKGLSLFAAGFVVLSISSRKNEELDND